MSTTVLMAFSFLPMKSSSSGRLKAVWNWDIEWEQKCVLISSISGSLHQLQNHTIFARICTCKKRTLNSPSSPPFCNKVLNLMNRLHITCLHPNKKESWGKEMVLHGEGRTSTVKNYDLGERIFRRFWIAMNDGCSVQLPYLCRVTWLFRT